MAFPRNPIATRDQAVLERKALDILKHPKVVETVDELRAWWPAQVEPSDDQRVAFSWAFREVVFGAAIWTANQDPQRPKVVTITRLAHELDELHVPGSRWGIDNPDSIYRVIPIDGAERYVIRGRVPKQRLTENYFTLWDEDMNTVDVLNGKDLELEADGSFRITVDDRKTNRPNHVLSSPTAREFFIRDVLLDWQNDRPNVLTVTKMGPAKTPEITPDEQAELTIRHLRRNVERSIRWNRQALDREANTFKFGINRDTDGALRNQIYLMGHFKLTDEQALIIDVDLAGAEYFIAPITNLWGTTNGIVDRTGSLNSHQATGNSDGTFTFVISPREPRVWNWLDPSGMHDGIVTLRWAEFPGGKAARRPTVRSRVVPFHRLGDQLGKQQPKLVGHAERRAQLAARAESYAWRLQ